MSEQDNLVNPETQESTPAKNAKDSAFSFPGPPKIDAPSEAYKSSDEHLWDELSRIDMLVRAQTILWRQTIAAVKPQRFWGMVHASDEEVDMYLRSSFTPPYQFAPHVKRVLETYWNEAKKLDKTINIRLEKTSPEIDLRLRRLQNLFKLSRLESDILLVVLLPELDGRYRRLYGYLLDDASKTQPTVDLVLQILYPVMQQFSNVEKNGSIFKMGRSVFNSDGNLSKHYLIQLNNTTQMPEPISLHSLRLNERISNYLLGNDALDRHLVGVTLFPFAGDPMHRLRGNKVQNNYLSEFARWWKSLKKNSDRDLVLYLHGQYGSGRLKAALRFCMEMESDLLLIDSTRVLDPAENWERFIDLCYREAYLRKAALCWLNCERYLAEDQPPNRWHYLVKSAENASILTFFSGETVWNPTDQFQKSLFLNVDFAMPDYEVRQMFWQKHLPPNERFDAPGPFRENLAALLATSFQLTEGQIVDAIAAAERVAILRDIQNQKLKADDLYAGCRRQSSRRLINLAQRIEPYTQLTFDNLILPRPNRRQLEELRMRICYQCKVYKGLGLEKRLTLGKGLIALFTGSSGTGKTMAAELLAREQGVDLYKIDLSAVVSKYVGETEKQLNRVFTEAADSNSIIFFDEADALFGKRGEVKEARDRWANIEINFLLQKVEEYAGVVILASNLRQNIDEAFMRRIHVIVEFPFPDVTSRSQIWSGLFPDSIQGPSDEEIQNLAKRFRLSGGSIKNIVIDAAFRAVAEADNGEPSITLRHVIVATAREYQKLGKPITKGEFGQDHYAWIEADILAKT